MLTIKLFTRDGDCFMLQEAQDGPLGTKAQMAYLGQLLAKSPNLEEKDHEALLSFMEGYKDARKTATENQKADNHP